MKSTRFSVVAAILIVGLASLSGAQTSDAARAMTRFEQEVAEYVALRRRLAVRLPPPRVSADAEKVAAMSNRLADAIRDARAGAVEGAMFPPDVAVAFRERIHGALTPAHMAASLLAEINEDAPPSRASLRVNGRFDWGYYGAIMPPRVIAVLPVLPGELQYRFVDRHLVLLDIDASLIVDLLPQALSRR